MKLGGPIVAINLDGDRLCALSAGNGDRVRVRAWLSSQVPSGVDMRSPEAMGTWIRGELERAGLAGSRAVFVVSRGDVVLKRLRLPRAEGVDETELAGMVRLQMARQLTMAIEGATIDYVPIGVEGLPTEPGQIDVLAGALPGDRMSFLRGLSSAAGLRVERVGLRSAGAAAILAEASAKRNGPILGIAMGTGSMEFVVVDAGRLVFARSADVGLSALAKGERQENFAERAAVEAKRTWMSYRVGPESVQVESVAVIGEGPLAAEVARRCGESLEIAWELVGIPKAIELPAAMPETERLVAVSLAGLLAEEILTTRTLDFAHPRKPPDRAAAKRQLVLLGVLLLIVVGGGGWYLAKRDLGRLGSDAAAARDRRSKLASQYAEFLLREARLRHLERWPKAGIDWVGHAAWLSDLMPDPRLAQLDSLAGRLAADVRFIPHEGGYSGGRWELRQEAVLSLQGPTRDRETANDLRARLVGSQIYTVDSKGPDVPRRFSFELTTATPLPSPPAPASEPTEGTR